MFMLYFSKLSHMDKEIYHAFHMVKSIIRYQFQF